MVIIEGVAFPIGEKNLNGWGIPASETDNAINSLKHSVVRVCTRDNEHGCDLSEDPRTEIGRIIDAWKDGNLIRTKAEITDPTASDKIISGTWEPTWSVYGRAAGDDDGWAKGFQARSMTLVRFPAWKQAQFEVAASMNHIVFSNNYKISSVGDTMSEEKQETTEPDATILASKDAEINTLKEELGKATAAIDELKASLEQEKIKTAGSLPADKSSELVKAQAQKIAEELLASQMEEQKKNDAIQKYASAATRLGIDYDTAMFAGMSADSIMTAAENMEAAASIAPKSWSLDLNYPANNNVEKKSTVGRYNSQTKQWEDF